jgi:hypothetical protein
MLVEFGIKVHLPTPPDVATPVHQDPSVGILVNTDVGTVTFSSAQPVPQIVAHSAMGAAVGARKLFLEKSAHTRDSKDAGSTCPGKELLT